MDASLSWQCDADVEHWQTDNQWNNKAYHWNTKTLNIWIIIFVMKCDYLYSQLQVDILDHCQTVLYIGTICIVVVRFPSIGILLVSTFALMLFTGLCADRKCSFPVLDEQMQHCRRLFDITVKVHLAQRGKWLRCTEKTNEVHYSWMLLEIQSCLQILQSYYNTQCYIYLLTLILLWHTMSHVSKLNMNVNRRKLSIRNQTNLLGHSDTSSFIFTLHHFIVFRWRHRTFGGVPVIPGICVCGGVGGDFHTSRWRVSCWLGAGVSWLSRIDASSTFSLRAQVWRRELPNLSGIVIKSF